MEKRNSSAPRGLRTTIALLCLFAALGALLALAAGEAEESVPLPGTQPADGSGDPSFPAFEDSGAPGTLDDPSRCAACHGGYRQFGEPIYEPYDAWAGSLMANSARDPLFWAALDIANQDDRDELGGVGVGEFCLKCHAPKAWLEGRVDCDTPWGERYDGACLEGTPSQRDNDYEGITCHFCHRQYDASNPPEGEFEDPNAPYEDNGSVFLSKLRNVMRGPLDDAEPFNHDWANSEFHASSAFCGQCHNVTSPARNRRDPETGEDLGYKLPVDRTYDEWKQSAFAIPEGPDFASCQECHMPAPDLDGDGRPNPAFACSTPPGRRGFATELDGPVRTHFFRGGSVFMLEALKGEYGRSLRRERQFDAAIEASKQLMTEALRTDLSSEQARVAAGGSVDATFTVINKAGHKFPSGYIEGRRAFVNLQAGEDRDGDGTLDADEISFESGAYDEESAILVEDEQARIYEAKVGIFNYNGDGKCDVVDASSGNKMFHFALNDCIKSDNRIPPKGFRPSEETAPVAAAYPENPNDPGALANWDVVPYSIPVPEDAYRPMLVKATVYYQSVSREYVQFLVDKNRSTCDPSDPGCDPTQPDGRLNRGEKMQQIWNRYGRSAPLAVASSQISVAVDGVPPTPGEASSRFATQPLLAAGFQPETGRIALTFEPACDARNHAVYWGPLSEVGTYAYTGARCDAGSAGQTTINPGAGSYFFLVVGHNEQTEGSYGLDAEGAQRPEDQGSCPLTQALEATVCE